MNTHITMPRWPGAISNRSSVVARCRSSERYSSVLPCLLQPIALYSSAIGLRGMIVRRNVDQLARPLHLDEEVRAREAEHDAHLVLVEQHRVHDDLPRGIGEREHEREAPAVGSTLPTR